MPIPPIDPVHVLIAVVAALWIGWLLRMALAPRLEVEPEVKLTGIMIPEGETRVRRRPY